MLEGMRADLLVLPEPSSSIFTKVVLREYRQTEGSEYTRVDSNTEVAQLGNQDRGEHEVEAKLGILLVQEIEGDGPSESGEQHVWHELDSQ